MQNVRIVTPLEQLVTFFFKFLFAIMIYLPFILAGILASIYGIQITKGGFITGLIFFLIGIGILYGLVYYIRILHYKFKNKDNKIWYLFFGINLVLVSGIPFITGGNMGLDMFKESIKNSFEKTIVFLIGGLILAVPAYIGVLKKSIIVQKESEQPIEAVPE